MSIRSRSAILQPFTAAESSLAAPSTASVPIIIADEEGGSSLKATTSLHHQKHHSKPTKRSVVGVVKSLLTNRSSSSASRQSSSIIAFIIGGLVLLMMVFALFVTFSTSPLSIRFKRHTTSKGDDHTKVNDGGKRRSRGGGGVLGGGGGGVGGRGGGGGGGDSKRRSRVLNELDALEAALAVGGEGEEGHVVAVRNKGDENSGKNKGWQASTAVAVAAMPTTRVELEAIDNANNRHIDNDAQSAKQMVAKNNDAFEARREKTPLITVDGKQGRPAMDASSSSSSSSSPLTLSPLLANYLFGCPLPLTSDSSASLPISICSHKAAALVSGGAKGVPNNQGQNIEENSTPPLISAGFGSNRVAPRFHFPNVFTTPLPLAEVANIKRSPTVVFDSSGRNASIIFSNKNAANGENSMIRRMDDAQTRHLHRIEKAFADNKIMKLYKDIPPSRVDASEAIVMNRDDGNRNSGGEEGVKKSSRGASSSSSFFSMMDLGLHSLHPMRRTVTDYIKAFAFGEGKEKKKAKQSLPSLYHLFQHKQRIRAPSSSSFSSFSLSSAYWSTDRPLLKELLMRYQSFHAEGMRRLRQKWKKGGGRGNSDSGSPSWASHASSSSSLTDADFSHFVVVRPVGQLCNRLVAITSAFIFALMTRRVLLIDDSDFYASLDDLFALPGFEWILREDASGFALNVDKLLGDDGVEGLSSSSSASSSPPLSSHFPDGFHLADFEAVGLNDAFVQKQKKPSSPSDADAAAGTVASINYRYGHANPAGQYHQQGGGGGNGWAAPPPPQYNPSPLSILNEVFSGDGGGGHQQQQQPMRVFTIENPEYGTWTETEKLLCSDDYRRTYKSLSIARDDVSSGSTSFSSSPSVVSFSVNQYLVPYYYRNPHYHEALVEVFGEFIDGSSPSTAGEEASSSSSSSFSHLLKEKDDVFSPIAHFLFRPLPSLLKARDGFIKKHFFDADDGSSDDDSSLKFIQNRNNLNNQGDASAAVAAQLIPSYVVGLQVRSGGDFTDHFMGRKDWELYRDCGLQTSPPDVALSSSLDAAFSHFMPSRKFKFFVATDTDKGRQAARQYLATFPAEVRVGNEKKAISSSSTIPVHFGPGEFKLSNNPEGVRAALLDLLLLASCDDRVQTAWSSYGYFASGISGFRGNIVTNRAPTMTKTNPAQNNKAAGNGASVAGVGEANHLCWAGFDDAQLSLVHADSLARHKGAISVLSPSPSSSNFALLSLEKVPHKTSDSGGHNSMSPPYLKSGGGSHHADQLFDANKRSVGEALATPAESSDLSTVRIADSSSSFLSFGVVDPNALRAGYRQQGKDGGSANTNSRESEQRYMGVMHKSDKRVQCVRMASVEPCFHKFESWGASRTTCHDWKTMAFAEMLRNGRYC